MPFDNNLVLRDGTIDLDPNEVVAAAITANADGAKVLDIRKTGPRGLVAVLICPTAPTDYLDVLDVVIQDSDNPDVGFAALATFPTKYAYMYRVRGVATQAFAAADLADYLVSTAGGSDTGIIRWYDKLLETVGGEGDILCEATDSGDIYDDVAGDTLTSGGGDGIATQLLIAGARCRAMSYGVYALRFFTYKRYIRALFTVSSGGNWGNVQLLLTNDGLAEAPHGMR